MEPRNTRLSVLLIALIGMGAATAALEPPRPGELQRYLADGTLGQRLAFAYSLGNHRASPQLASRANERLRGLLRCDGGGSPAPPPRWAGMPTKGTVRILALLIAFADMAPNTSAEEVNSLLFGEGNPSYFPNESLRNFYRRSSYDQLEIAGTTLGWYTTEYPRGSVVQTQPGREALVKEALRHYDREGFDFSPFDNDGDGVIEYVLVIWTGPDSGWGGFWWGYYWSPWGDPSFQLDGKRLARYSWQWEANPYPGTYHPGVAIHETGHALGVPDYYDYQEGVGPEGGVGGLDLMDGYGDHNCWSKFMLEWLTPTVLREGEHELTLRPSETSKDALLMAPPGAQTPFGEFFMVQNRRAGLGNDPAGYPADGLVIWHVDARLDYAGFNFQYDNQYAEHKHLKLEQADGLEEVERMINWLADSGDIYTPGDAFTPATFPNSGLYDGTESGVSIGDIAGEGEDLSLKAAFLPAEGAPFLASAAKRGSPFRIVVRGNDFQPGLTATLNGTPWAGVTVNSSTQITLTGGRSLKSQVPRRALTLIKVENPDGAKGGLVWSWQ